MGLFSRHTNRERIIISFLVVLVLLNALTIITSRNLSGFSDDFNSILEERLIPASDLSKIKEGLYRNRINQEELVFMSGFESKDHLMQELMINHVAIDSIKACYASTYLTEDEAHNLYYFNQLIDYHREIANKIIKYLQRENQEAASNMYLEQSGSAFEELVETVRSLDRIQLSVGQNLYQQHAERKVKIIQVFAYLSIAITLMITLNMLKVLRYKVG